MTFQTDIEFRNIDRSESVEAEVRRRLDKLERFAHDVMRCRVVVEAPHKHHGKGRLFHVSIDLHTPGGEIVVNRDPGKNHAHEDVYVAIRDAVDAAARRLQDHVRVRRGDVKSHESPGHGRVAELHPDRDFGRISAADGRMIYFHRNSLIGSDFDALTVGADVRFDEEAGDQGPQATTVRVIGKHHIVA